MSSRKLTIGIIAEDDSDVDTLKELIRRILPNQVIGFKKFIGRGCGKLKKKCSEWASQLKLRGCNVLILVHDLDSNDYKQLYDLLEKSLNPFAIKDTFISIPIREMEAWFLSDPDGIKEALNLNSTPRTPNHPETICSPKETLRDLVYKFSNHSKIYLNTKHNSIIAKYLNIQLAKSKCPSFDKLHNFVTKQT